MAESAGKPQASKSKTEKAKVEKNKAEKSDTLRAASVKSPVVRRIIRLREIPRPDRKQQPLILRRIRRIMLTVN